MDILTAILLSLATIGSAWCAYQSTLWGGVQTFELVDVNKAGRLSSENFIRGNQKRTADAIILMKYIDASEEGNIKMRDFYFSRFDSTLKNSTSEWLKLDPFNNPGAPNSPMRMKSYVLKEETEADNQLNRSGEKLASANEANRISDTYILLTVLFAAVLFFGGVAGTLQSDLVRNICLILSAIIFCVTLFVLISMPVTTI
ncbi:MAG: hypothetical protein IPL53_05340 [Ignavibacteria bacterium]|nr:hypothetical protein [Ignavibacteria bacterium]